MEKRDKVESNGQHTCPKRGKSISRKPVCLLKSQQSQQLMRTSVDNSQSSRVYNHQYTWNSKQIYSSYKKKHLHFEFWVSISSLSNGVWVKITSENVSKCDSVLWHSVLSKLNLYCFNHLAIPSSNSLSPISPSLSISKY